MPEITAIPDGAPCWLDLGTSDLEAAKTFYSELFGWEFANTGEEFGGYHIATLNGRQVAGAMATDGQSQPDAWGVYLRTPDARATAAAFTEAGGTLLGEPIQVGERGTMMLGFDAVGAFIGGWQPDDFAGFELFGQHGAPCWFEAITRDLDASTAFYERVFGWHTAVMSDTPESRYRTLGEGANASAGLMADNGFLCEGVGSAWQLYLGVDDTDQAVARCGELGGTVLNAPTDTDFGRAARLADTTGAAFSIISV